MPLREQSRIRGSEPASTEEAAKEAPAPAPEPSAPPAGVPVCKAWCGLTRTHAKVPASHWQRLGDDSRTAYCSADCADACRPLSLPTSDPITVATGGVPAGYRLGAGWVVDRTYLCSCTGCRPNTSTEYYKPRSCGKGACAAHAVLMGALVPIDTARSVPPGASLLDSAALSAEWWPTPPSAIVSEPAVRPLSAELRAAAEDLKRLLQYRDADGRLHSPAHGVLGAWKHLVRRFEGVADLEAELATRTAQVDLVRVTLTDERDAARAEVEQLRGKLAEAERLSDSWRRAAIRATARVRSMRDAAANGTT